jgi:hypothetical protein
VSTKVNITSVKQYKQKLRDYQRKKEKRKTEGKKRKFLGID